MSEPSNLSEPSILAAAEAMTTGAVVAYPTEAVFGLGCDPHNESAVASLLAIKQRPVEKGLILLAASIEQLITLLPLGELPEDQQRLLAKAWPGSVSFAIDTTQGQIPAWIQGEHKSVVVRVTAHPIAGALANAFGGPIVSTSANLAGEPPARTPQELSAMRHKLAVIVAGDVGGRAAPCPIFRLSDGTVLRD